MAPGAHIFVALVYATLAASFVASTATLVQEFKDLDWISLALTHSHLFIFFPTFGIVVLAAFYWPAVIFTNLYWTKGGVRYGPLRFLVGFAVVIGASWWVAQQIGSADLRGLWEIQPATLERDGGGPMSCTSVDGVRTECRRSPFLTALNDLRSYGTKRTGFAEFTRNCAPDPLLEPPPEYKEKRYCFAAGQMLDTRQCCDVQRRFAQEVRDVQADPQLRSRTSELDQYFLPLKVFFIVIMVVIAGLLAFRHKQVAELYPRYLPAIERGIIIGGFAMLIWPLMDYAYLQTSLTLFGRQHGGFHLRWSLVIVPWAILLPFFFLSRAGSNLERIAQIASVLASFVAVMRYQQINDIAVRVFGAGAERWVIGLMAGLALLAFIGLFWQTEPEPEEDDPPPEPLT